MWLITAIHRRTGARVFYNVELGTFGSRYVATGWTDRDAAVVVEGGLYTFGVLLQYHSIEVVCEPI